MGITCAPAAAIEQEKRLSTYESDGLQEKETTVGWQSHYSSPVKYQWTWIDGICWLQVLMVYRPSTTSEADSRMAMYVGWGGAWILTMILNLFTDENWNHINLCREIFCARAASRTKQNWRSLAKEIHGGASDRQKVRNHSWPRQMQMSIPNILIYGGVCPRPAFKPCLRDQKRGWSADPVDCNALR